MLKPALVSAVLALAGSFAAPAFAAAPKPGMPPAPQDFAYAVPLQFAGQEAIYQLNLPLSVYRHCVRSDLGDLRVFNAAGELVPHNLLQPAASSIAQAQGSRLNFFPLHGRANEGLDQLTLRIRRNASGTLLNIDNTAQPAARRKLAGYLLDLGPLDTPLQALDLEWGGTGDNFVGSVQLDSSDDLQHWRNVVSNAPLASLQYGGQHLLQKQVAFAPLRARYLRLSWPQGQTALQLVSVQAELAPVSVEAPLNWQSAYGAAVPEHPGEYQFDLGARLPVKRMRILLPQINTLVQASLFSRAQMDDAWSPVTSAQLYQLQHAGQTLRNPDLTLHVTQRYWLLRVEQKNGGLGNGTPQLQAGWQPQILQFVTRGNAPFLLAYGSNKVQAATMVLPPLATASTANPGVASAQSGAEYVLGGERNITLPAPALPWKKWILWGVLVSAALLLGWMAYRLVQQMNAQGQRGG